jgi:hypothetical protein
MLAGIWNFICYRKLEGLEDAQSILQGQVNFFPLSWMAKWKESRGQT